MNRDTIINEAIDRCLEEMYQKSQPSASYHEYLEKAKRGEITKKDHVYNRHYLNKTQFKYILNKYIKAYRLQNEWKSDIEFLVQNLEEGGRRDCYKENSNGTKYRTSEQMKPIKDIIGEKNARKLFTYIDEIKNFYRFDREEQIFSFEISLGVSPTSNEKIVEEYWKSQGIDIHIDTTELSEDDYWKIDEYGHLLEEEEE